MEVQELQNAVKAAQAGEVEGFEFILNAYRHRLYGYFFRALANHHNAEDLLSDISFRLVKVIHRYDDRGRFEPWLFRIAANLVRDRFRRKKTRGNTLSLSQENASGKSMDQQLPGRDEPVDRQMLSEEVNQQLQDALARLDDTTREMVLLRYFGEMSFKELSAKFDCPLGTVLAKVHRALKSLKETMADQ